MSGDRAIMQVALKTPLMTCFDYTAGPGGAVAAPGARVRVPFGRGQRIGVVLDTTPHSAVPSDRLRPVSEILDEEPILDESLLALLRFAAEYYRHPPGEVIAAALPRLLRAGRPLAPELSVWTLDDAGAALEPSSLARRAPKQAAALAALRASPGGLDGEALRSQLGPNFRPVLARLERRGWVRRRAAEPPPAGEPGEGQPAPFELTAAQRAAIAQVQAGQFGTYLLHGVTGSGKTEVYLRLIAAANAVGRQALVLVPEIGLTPQLLRRFRQRLNGRLVAMHSGLSDAERLAAWRDARNGRAAVVVGTRSAIFAPLAAPGLIVIDEEHDPSYKQQDGFRYSARDLAVVRARLHDVPAVLGSATPSFESLHNARRGRYVRLDLRARAGAGELPPMRLIDMRREPLDGGLSLSLRNAMRHHLDAGGQVLLFLNRRGYAPAWYCPDCGWIARCRRCDARMTLHARDDRLLCHHCGAGRTPEPQCPDCEAAPVAVGQGTERIDETIGRLFPGIPAARIDRDTTRRRGALEQMVRAIRAGHHRVLIGTQMLTKGHHFPAVTLVGIVDADQGLFGTDPRSNERLAQLIVQVAGRAGRAERRGEVLIQTHCPTHPLLTTLLREGYEAFADAALSEREAAGWPPYTSLALLRAEAAAEGAPLRFLAAARDAATVPAGITLLGPAPAPMPRRAGRYRAQLLVQGERRRLQHFLRAWSQDLADLPGARHTRWSLDVDPVELY